MKIIGFGYPCMDMNVLCPSVPDKDELVEMLDVNLMGGGKVANAIIAAARLGGDTGIIGAVGTDRYGKLCKDDFVRHGVDVSELKQREGHTAFCLSIVDEKEREKHYIESPATFDKLSADDISEEYVKTADYLLLYNPDDTALMVADTVRKNGGLIELDGDQPGDNAMESLSKVDILVASEYFYRYYFKNDDFKNNLLILSQKGPDIVLVTLGGKGCVGIDHGRFFQIDSYKVPVRDTTGAGDVFHGAFVYGLSEGMNAEDAAKMASAVSAVKCTVLGGRTGIPTKQGVLDFMETGEIQQEDFKEREMRYRDDMWR